MDALFFYSVFGTVTSLSGKPEEGITLEARSESRGYYEETITDSEGKYRLRGLLPDTKYTVRAVLKVDKPGLHRIERSSPSSVPVQVAFSSSNLSFCYVRLLDMFGLGALQFVTYNSGSLIVISTCMKHITRNKSFCPVLILPLHELF